MSAPDAVAVERAGDEPRRRANTVLLRKLCIVAAGMFAFGYALVPFYDKICEAAGLRNIAQADEVANTQVVAGRDVRIEFDSNVHDIAWKFRALEPVISVHPGEVRQVEFEIANTTDHAITGQAIPSYGPAYASQYFKKLECFCFRQQTLQAGETRRMPVVFVVDPHAPADLATITLSYTFFVVEGNRS